MLAKKHLNSPGTSAGPEKPFWSEVQSEIDEIDSIAKFLHIEVTVNVVVVAGDAHLPITIRRAEAGARSVLSGGYNTLLIVGTEREAKCGKEAALRMGVPEWAIMTDGKSIDTVDNAMKAKELLFGMNASLNRLKIVTSRFHMPRALFAFKQIFGNEAKIEHEAVKDDDIPNFHRYLLEFFPPLLTIMLAKILPAKLGELRARENAAVNKLISGPKAAVYKEG